jgi:hypothetical protein
VHDHVNDSRLTHTTLAARDHFHTAWAAEFGEKIEVLSFDAEAPEKELRWTSAGLLPDLFRLREAL